jgi:glucuronoarabinoxylan endo-1,4-beta-xylanase
MKKWFMIALLLIGQACYAQSATINWDIVHQVIDGFGGSDISSPLTSAQQQFFFGTGSVDLGLSMLRVVVPDNAGYPGVCTSVGSSCVSTGNYVNYISDMQAAIADGARIYASSLTPPPSYKTNGDEGCSTGSGSGALISSDYGAFATWLANFVESLQSVYSIHLYALSIDNEPDYCASYASSIWSAANIDTFIKSNLGPTFASDGLSTLILMPETGTYGELSSYGSTCATDSSCASYLGGVNWHDYDASVTVSTPSANSTPYPSGWPSGKKYWETEVTCSPSAGPAQCENGGSTFETDMANDGLMWAALIDDRMAVENANAYLAWWLVNEASGYNEGLMCGVSACGTVGTIPQRAYVFGQYARFIRPGYYRVDATHVPQAGISVSAYQNASTGQLVIVATNYTPSAVTQSFNIINAPTFTSMTPYVTSATQQIQAQSAESVTGNSFAYTLPADSVTTFVGESSPTAAPAAPTNLQATVN